MDVNFISVVFTMALLLVHTDVKHMHSKPLHFEEVEDDEHIQKKDTVLRTLQKLVALAGSGQYERRSSLFYELVSSLRAMRNNTLSLTISEMMQASAWLTWQALLQCGTQECTSVMLQTTKTLDGLSIEVDALVYGLGLQANPDTTRVQDMLSMAQYKQSKAIMYALANTVKKYVDHFMYFTSNNTIITDRVVECNMLFFLLSILSCIINRYYKGEVTTVLKDVSEFMENLLNGCLGGVNTDTNSVRDADEMTFLVLRVLIISYKSYK